MRFSALAILPCALLLASCASSTRLGDAFDFGSSQRPPPNAGRPVPAPEPLMAAPTEDVTSQPLPPAGGQATPGAPAAPSTSLAPPGNQVASVAPTAPRPPTTGGIAGSWKISDAARGSCNISLTRQALLDVYRASPSGCQAGSLAKVNAWQQRGQEIDLLEPGGRTAVRLFPTGDGAYEGAATLSGAKIRMTK
ncbi:AprI/Inh family metalloprotease inhibitor [Labrys neptuniae]